MYTHARAHTFSLNLDDWVFSYLIGSAVSATLPLSFRSKERITLSAPFPSLSRCISSALLLAVFPPRFPPLSGTFFLISLKPLSGKEKVTECYSKCHAVSLIQELVACEETVIWKRLFPDVSCCSLMMCKNTCGLLWSDSQWVRQQTKLQIIDGINPGRLEVSHKTG